VTLRSLLIIGGSSESTPVQIKVYVSCVDASRALAARVSLRFWFHVVRGDETDCFHSWVNRNDLSFSNCHDVTPAQKFEVHYDPAGEIEYPTMSVAYLSS
jgi:hypothetical protein